MSATCTFVEHHLQLYCDDLISGKFSIWGGMGEKEQFITKIDKYSQELWEIIAKDLVISLIFRIDKSETTSFMISLITFLSTTAY